MSTMATVDKIINNLRDRRGFDQAFDVDDDIFEEIRQEMAYAIDVLLRQCEWRHTSVRASAGRRAMKMIALLVEDSEGAGNCTVNFNPDHIMTIRTRAYGKVEIQLITGLLYICPAIARATERLREAKILP